MSCGCKPILASKVPHGLLGACLYPTFGQYEKGVEVAKQLVEIDPDFPIGYLQLAFNNQFAGHLEEAENALQRASDRKLEIPELLIQRYDIAFLKGDQAGMDREVALGQKESGAEDMIADRQAFVLAYSGHLEKAKSMAQRAADLNQQPDQRGRKALIEIGPALWEAFFGNVSAARKRATAAADLSTDRDVEYGAPSPWLSRGNLPAHEHSRRIWRRASRRIRQSNSFTCRRFAHFSR